MERGDGGFALVAIGGEGVRSEALLKNGAAPFLLHRPLRPFLNKASEQTPSPPMATRAMPPSLLFTVAQGDGKKG